MHSLSHTHTFTPIHPHTHTHTPASFIISTRRCACHLRLSFSHCGGRRSEDSGPVHQWPQHGAPTLMQLAVKPSHEMLPPSWHGHGPGLEVAQAPWCHAGQLGAAYGVASTAWAWRIHAMGLPSPQHNHHPASQYLPAHIRCVWSAPQTTHHIHSYTYTAGLPCRPSALISTRAPTTYHLDPSGTGEVVIPLDVSHLPPLHAAPCCGWWWRQRETGGRACGACMRRWQLACIRWCPMYCVSDACSNLQQQQAAKVLGQCPGSPSPLLGVATMRC